MRKNWIVRSARVYRTERGASDFYPSEGRKSYAEKDPDMAELANELSNQRKRLSLRGSRPRLQRLHDAETD